MNDKVRIKETIMGKNEEFVRASNVFELSKRLLFANTQSFLTTKKVFKKAKTAS